MFETFFQDLKIGFRVLIKEKSFCALAVLVLGLGIGGVTTQFAVVNGVLLHAFEFPGADRLMDVNIVQRENFTPSNFRNQMLSQDYADMREHQQSFEYFTAYLNGSTVNLTYQSQPRRLTGGYVTHDFFDAVGVFPALGRDFLPEDDQPGVNKAVIISDALWKRDFGADPNVIERTVNVNGVAGTIIGVMPPKFNFPANEEVWLPLHSSFPVRPRNDPNDIGVAILGKLRPGVSIDQAQAEVTSFAANFAQEFPDTNSPFTLGYVRPLIATFTGPQLTGMLLIMLAFCVGVLLIACVNVMNMQFARATLRAKELAIRSSLGATRIRLIRQMLTESLLVASIGALLGIAIAAWSVDFIDAAVHNAANPIPSWMTFELSGKVLASVLVATTLSALVSGFVPAWISSRASSIEVLKEGGRGNTSRSFMIISRGLVVFQIVMTCVLLIGSMLQLQSIRNQQSVDFGYDTGSVLAGRMGLMEGDYPTNASRQQFYETLVRELRASGQFESVALTNRFRMVFSGNGPIEIEGEKYLEDSDRQIANFENITPGYLETLNLRVLDGRDFTENDSDQNAPVAIVNASFAQKHFGHESPIGRRFRTVNGNGTTIGPWREIIGVAATARMQGPFNTQVDDSGFYLPYFATAFGPVLDEPNANQFGTVVVRPRGGQRPEALVNQLQALVNRVDPNLPMYFVETPATTLDALMSQNRLVGNMFLLFGIVAVGLAAVGLYGVMSFTVNQRTQEIGVRMALGADNRTILGMVMRQGAIQVGIGLALGLSIALTIAFIFGSGLSTVLIDVSPSDPLTYIGVTLLLCAVAAVAAFVPARRATRVDPMIALRAD
ncbi:ABC transporter permease [Synoicihabitans lomoniglobus]|uniref:ABC transporter permease n=1 Tax=Synoicihabitans lomoniglobus TaxID=2909285 RepID=A0AAF0I4L3_9BACT|nr:ABC transporter permease [Opitutaceae bacterium LMO-M01]WED66555.1 ABC transporter permease [Opitutaceae bacterium LMO-M01]